MYAALLLPQSYEVMWKNTDSCLEIGNALKIKATKSVPGQHLCIDLTSMMGLLGRKTDVQMFAGLES